MSLCVCVCVFLFKSACLLVLVHTSSWPRWAVRLIGSCSGRLALDECLPESPLITPASAKRNSNYVLSLSLSLSLFLFPSCLSLSCAPMPKTCYKVTACAVKCENDIGLDCASLSVCHALSFFFLVALQRALISLYQ